MISRALATTMILLFPLALRAADTNPAPADDTTPLGLIRSQTSVIAAGGSAVARSRMHVAADKFNALADQLATLQAASAKLNAAIEAQWGVPAAADFSHALGSVAAIDADDADVTVSANHADIHWKTVKTPTYLVLIDGHWKYDVDRTLDPLDARTLALTEAYYKKLAPQVEQLYQQYQAGDFKSADDLVRHARLAAAKVSAALESP